MMKSFALLFLALAIPATPAQALPTEFHVVTPTLYRGARPTPLDLKALKAYYGVRTIITLENDIGVVRAETEAANQIGLRVVNIPLFANRPPQDAEVNRAIAELFPTGMGRSFVHCLHGQDRTGLVVALFRVEHQGWTPANAYNEMMRNGFNMKYAFPLEIYFRQRTGYTGPGPAPIRRY